MWYSASVDATQSLVQTQRTIGWNHFRMYYMRKHTCHPTFTQSHSEQRSVRCSEKTRVCELWLWIFRSIYVFDLYEFNLYNGNANRALDLQLHCRSPVYTETTWICHVAIRYYGIWIRSVRFVQLPRFSVNCSTKMKTAFSKTKRKIIFVVCFCASSSESVYIK